MKVAMVASKSGPLTTAKNTLWKQNKIIHIKLMTEHVKMKERELLKSRAIRWFRREVLLKLRLLYKLPQFQFLFRLTKIALCITVVEL